MNDTHANNDADATGCVRCADRGWNLRDGQVEVCGCGAYDDPPRWVRHGDRPCLLEHWRDPNRPRRAAAGWLCAGHAARFTQMLAELPALHDDLGLMLTAAERHNADQGKATNGAKPSGLNLNEKIIEARREVHNECVRMVREVLDEDPDAGPPLLDTVPTLALWLLAHVDWLTAQDGADDTYRYLATLYADSRRLAYPAGVRRTEIGSCGEADCPGRLWLSGSSDDARTMACDDCKRVVEPRYWRRERRRIDGVDVNPWLTLAEAAVQYGTTTRTVERWVAKGRLKSRGTPRRVKASAVEQLMQAFANRSA